MTALGIALTVAVLVADLALVHGLQMVFKASGHPLQILVLRKGLTAELSSAMSREVYYDLKFQPGIATNSAGEPMASLEMVTVINLSSVDSPTGMHITLRGLLPVGITMRQGYIQQGRWFRLGQREVVVGKAIAKRYLSAQLGNRLRFGRGEWDVVGVMDAGESAINSEIWGDLNQVSADFNRQNVLSSVLVRTTDAAAVPILIKALNDNRRLSVSAMTERTYYDNQTVSGAPLKFLGLFVSVIMAVGSSFAAMNTMYAAVIRRTKEIGTLRVLGFSRGSILVSFWIESLMLSLLGGMIGCLLVLPLNNVTTGIGSMVTFSEIAFNFRMSLGTMLTGIVFALLVGAIGGFFPARMAARKEVLAALQEI
jgi:putative ABC transport system permease protein